MQIVLPDKVRQIITVLQENGHEAYAVGGCVRDMLLKREPDDWDITTSADPEETKRLFERTFDTGIEHGTVSVLLGGESFEVTTYRIDGKYEDGRHPSEVKFTRSLSEDLLRRDFTINAMAYNDKDGLVDLFGGREDLGQQIIRCVGNAKERFSEDALRILRAVRFAAQLGFTIADDTKEAIRLLAPNLRMISAERIQAEIVKLLTSSHPECIRLAYELGITQIILPEFDAMMETTQETLHHFCSVGEHTIHALSHIAPDKVLRLTMLFHDMGKPAKKTVDEEQVAHFKGHAEVSRQMAADIMHRLKFDNDTLRKVEKLVHFHDYRIPAEIKSVRRTMNKIGEELFPDYMQVRRADILAQSDYQRAEKLANLDGIERLYQEIVRKRQCVSLKDLAVNGSDLIKAGVKPGPRIGEILKTLLEEVIEEPERNTAEYLLGRVQEVLYDFVR